MSQATDAPDSGSTQDNALPVPVRPTAPVRGEDAIASLVPFGLGEDKPAHARIAASALWSARGRVGDTWRLLSQGVCDACSLGPRGLRDDAVSGLHLCALRLEGLERHFADALVPADLLDLERLQGMEADALAALGRLPVPFLWEQGDRGFRQLGWDEALGLVGTRLASAPPQRVGLAAGGQGLSNESYFMMAHVAELLGSPHAVLSPVDGPDPAMPLVAQRLGVGAATCGLGDLVGTELLLILGADLRRRHPAAMKLLVAAKRHGTRVVVIDAVRDAGLDSWWEPTDPRSALFGSRIADDVITVKGGGDQAMLQAVLKAVVERDATDAPFVARHSQGFEALSRHLAQLSWQDLAERSGTSGPQQAWLAELCSRARSMVIVAGRGLARSDGGPAAIGAAIDLLLARGMFGRPGCGLMPLTGPPGQQGAIDCGLQIAGTLPGRLDVLTTLGDAGGASIVAGLRVHQDVVLRPQHLSATGQAILLLPARTRHEQLGGGTTTSVERRIRYSPQIFGGAPGVAQAHWWALCQAACKARPDLAETLRFKDSQEVRRLMADRLPRYHGIQSLRGPGDWVQWGGPVLGRGGFDDMPDRRARFSFPEADL